MDLDRCKTVLLVAELKNLSLAAKALSYTPSGVSRVVAAMEKELGFKLFYRVHDGLELTPDGELILPKLRSFVFSGDVCLQYAASVCDLDVGTVTVGCAYSAYYGALSKLISGFCELHPGINLRLRHGSSTELARRLCDRELDMCLISRRDGAFKWHFLCSDELTAWVPASSSLATETAVPLSVFEREPYIDILFDPDSSSDNSILFEKHGICPNTQFSVTDSASGYRMVEAGLGIAMNNALNGKDFSGAVSVLPLSPRSFVEIGIASLTQPSPAASAFLRYIISNGLEM